MKKALFLVFLVIFSSFAFADSISNYKVSPAIPLNQNLTIYGQYSGGQDVLCAFYVFDVAALDFNKVIIRLNDSYTFSDGSFYNEIKIEEPLFQRGIDYNAITKCGTTEIGQVFIVGQREGVAGYTSNTWGQDLAWAMNNDNIFVIVVGGISFIAIAVFLARFGGDIYNAFFHRG